MGSYINTDYFNYMFEIGQYGLIFGFIFATLLKFVSYGIFKAISLIDINKR